MEWDELMQDFYVTCFCLFVRLQLKSDMIALVMYWVFFIRFPQHGNFIIRQMLCSVACYKDTSYSVTNVLPSPIYNFRSVRAYDSNGTCQFNLLKPNDIYIYICRTAALTSRRYISNIYSTNIHTEYFKHSALSPFSFLFKMPFIS